MCNTKCILFGAINLKKEEIEGKRIIEIGSLDVNGSLRPLLESYNPKEYIGVDIVKGPGVDKVCNVENLVEEFGENVFDVVISTELLEHVKDWRKAISNMKKICKEGGFILITTRSKGFHYHGYPYDFWRFEIDDMMNIFQDCEILALEKDSSAPGVFIKAKKMNNFNEIDLSSYALYSIILNRKVKDIEEKDLKSFYFKFSFKRVVFKAFQKIATTVN
ncbi:class I SAM-dependent methyltransferase [Methanocella conradii]|uniref:class I SAM-dependent methyltransferase n=1 Tax=Methanocella conradii TaxID=1175444 RepID=UPI0024B36F26|nr:class I SAM-dependent methyltransferase [Methanocella conradii]MDI6895984.1 class I SAM-dependent methyltransferase [Methanocella conradii]